jgi:hypothetical protein
MDRRPKKIAEREEVIEGQRVIVQVLEPAQSEQPVDFLDLSHWGRAVMQDIDFYDVGGQTVFPIHLLLRHQRA